MKNIQICLAILLVLSLVHIGAANSFVSREKTIDIEESLLAKIPLEDDSIFYYHIDKECTDCTFSYSLPKYEFVSKKEYSVEGEVIRSYSADKTYIVLTKNDNKYSFIVIAPGQDSVKSIAEDKLADCNRFFFNHLKAELVCLKDNSVVIATISSDAKVNYRIHPGTFLNDYTDMLFADNTLYLAEKGGISLFKFDASNREIHLSLHDLTLSSNTIIKKLRYDEKNNQLYVFGNDYYAVIDITNGQELRILFKGSVGEENIVNILPNNEDVYVLEKDSDTYKLDLYSQKTNSAHSSLEIRETWKFNEKISKAVIEKNSLFIDGETQITRKKLDANTEYSRPDLLLETIKNPLSEKLHYLQIESKIYGLESRQNKLILYEATKSDPRTLDCTKQSSGSIKFTLFLFKKNCADFVPNSQVQYCIDKTQYTINYKSETAGESKDGLAPTLEFTKFVEFEPEDFSKLTQKLQEFEKKEDKDPNPNPNPNPNPTPNPDPKKDKDDETPKPNPNPNPNPDPKKDDPKPNPNPNPNPNPDPKKDDNDDKNPKPNPNPNPNPDPKENPKSNPDNTKEDEEADKEINEQDKGNNPKKPGKSIELNQDFWIRFGVGFAVLIGLICVVMYCRRKSGTERADDDDDEDTFDEDSDRSPEGKKFRKSKKLDLEMQDNEEDFEEED